GPAGPAAAEAAQRRALRGGVRGAAGGPAEEREAGDLPQHVVDTDARGLAHVGGREHHRAGGGVAQRGQAPRRGDGDLVLEGGGGQGQVGAAVAQRHGPPQAREARRLDGHRDLARSHPVDGEAAAGIRDGLRGVAPAFDRHGGLRDRGAGGVVDGAFQPRRGRGGGVGGGRPRERGQQDERGAHARGPAPAGGGGGGRGPPARGG